MPELKNSNETFWVIFKHCGILFFDKIEYCLVDNLDKNWTMWKNMSWKRIDQNGKNNLENDRRDSRTQQVKYLTNCCNWVPNNFGPLIFFTFKYCWNNIIGHKMDHFERRWSFLTLILTTFVACIFLALTSRISFASFGVSWVIEAVLLHFSCFYFRDEHLLL